MWAPADRTLRTVAQDFPHVTRVGGPQIVAQDSFFLASREPVTLDVPMLDARLAATRKQGLTAHQLSELERFVHGVFLEPALPSPADADVNRDLFPKDEYGHW